MAGGGFRLQGPGFQVSAEFRLQGLGFQVSYLFIPVPRDCGRGSPSRTRGPCHSSEIRTRLGPPRPLRLSLLLSSLELSGTKVYEP